jgi:hypothetical protein
MRYNFLFQYESTTIELMNITLTPEHEICSRKNSKMEHYKTSEELAGASIPHTSSEEWDDLSPDTPLIQINNKNWIVASSS